MDRLDAIRTLIAVVRHHGFNRAARVLGRSPSAVSRQVAQLEDQLGVALLVRTTRALSLTDAGYRYLELGGQILEDLDFAERQVRGEDAIPRGSLRVAAPVLFGRLQVLPVITRMLDAWPGLSISLALSDRNTALIEEGVDVAVRIGDLPDSGLLATRLGAVTRVVVASPAYLATRPAPKTPTELSGHRLIGFEGVEAAPQWRLADGPIRIHARFTLDNLDAVIAAAEAGAGLAQLFSYQAREAVLAGRLVPLLADFAPPPLPVHALQPHRRIASRNAAAVIDAMRAGIDRKSLLLPA